MVARINQSYSVNTIKGNLILEMEMWYNYYFCNLILISLNRKLFEAIKSIIMQIVLYSCAAYYPHGPKTDIDQNIYLSTVVVT